MKKTELEPPCLNLSTTKTTIISSDMHKCKAATITTPQSTISSMLTTVFTTKNNFNTTSSYVESSNSQQHLHHYDDQNESRKLWKPRRLHFVLHLPIIGNDPYILLMKLIDTLKHYQCTYHFLNSYRLHCTKLLNSSLMNYNDNIDHNEQYKPLITSIETNNQQLIQSTLFTMNSVDKCNLLTWDMEIFQLAKPINYGVRFKRISGNRNAFKIIRKYFLQEFTNKLC
ncbi:Serine/threonine-protein kinase MARK2 [Schistosoma japonicum]|nr:Serine/threonine-protein kinase MARK2 [Schistosoma japonicum]